MELNASRIKLKSAVDVSSGPLAPDGVSSVSRAGGLDQGEDRKTCSGSFYWRNRERGSGERLHPVTVTR